MKTQLKITCAILPFDTWFLTWCTAQTPSCRIVMTPHSLRHAFATKILEAPGDLAVVQDMLGHASPATTRVYAKVSSKRMRDAHRTAFGYRGAEDA